jgi:hypothetical protein
MFVIEILPWFEILKIFLTWNTFYVIFFGSGCGLSPIDSIIYMLTICLFISRVSFFSFMLSVFIKKSLIFVNTFKSVLSWGQSVGNVRLLLNWEGSVSLEREISGSFESTHGIIDSLYRRKIFVKRVNVSDFKDGKIRMIICCFYGDSFLRWGFEHFDDEIRGKGPDRFEYFIKGRLNILMLKVEFSHGFVSFSPIWSGIATDVNDPEELIKVRTASEDFLPEVQF